MSGVTDQLRIPNSWAVIHAGRLRSKNSHQHWNVIGAYASLQVRLDCLKHLFIRRRLASVDDVERVVKFPIDTFGSVPPAHSSAVSDLINGVRVRSRGFDRFQHFRDSSHRIFFAHLVFLAIQLDEFSRLALELVLGRFCFRYVSLERDAPARTHSWVLTVNVSRVRVHRRGSVSKRTTRDGQNVRGFILVSHLRRRGLFAQRQSGDMPSKRRKRDRRGVGWHSYSCAYISSRLQMWLFRSTTF